MTRLTTAWIAAAGHRTPRGRKLFSGFALGALAVLGALAPAGATAAGCPNEGLRLGPSAQLPECRAYEMVSPPDKGGGNVFPIDVPHASASGEQVSFTSNFAFAGAEGNPIEGTYISRLGGGNWQTENVDPRMEARSFEITLPTRSTSPDFSKSIGLSQLALTPGADEGGSNIYIRDNATGERHLVAALESPLVFERLALPGSGPLAVTGTSDWSHLLISSKYPLTGETTEGKNNLYDYTGGRLHLVNYIPVAGGAEALAENATAVTSDGHGYTVGYQHAMSADGSRIFFTVNGSVYMREDDARTVPISVAEDGTVISGVSPVASGNGEVVFFTGSAGITADECAVPQCLYRYDLGTGEITNLTPAPPTGNFVWSILGLAEDGSAIYFDDNRSLVPGAPEPSGEEVDLYVWREGALQYIGETAEGDGETTGPQTEQVSPNGRYLAFATYSPMNEPPETSPSCPSETNNKHVPGECEDVYLYDAQAKTLNCASCDAPGRGDSALGGQEEKRDNTVNDEYSRAVLDNGTVYFDSPNRLVSRDTNRALDVYGWRAGSTQLYSTGTEETASNFSDSAREGQDVFFITAQPLVRQDVDGTLDVYDARVDGGLAAQWPPSVPPACEAEGCREAAPAAPAGLPFGSGVANVEPCVAPDAGRAAQGAKKLTKQAQRVARRGGKKAAKRADKLRRQAAAQRRQAKRLKKQAKNCGEVGR